MKHVAIIGAGITGLSAAFYLRRNAAARGVPLSITLIEAEARPGGKIVTAREGQFTIEGGPDSFITEKPWGLQLCRDLGIADELIPSNEQQKTIYVLRRGRLVPFPHGFRLTIPTAVWPLVTSPLLSPAGKLRMAMDLVIPPRRETSDESLASFITRRFGRETLDAFAGPLLAGIFVSDPARMSMLSTFPRLLAMEREHGSLIRAVRRLKNRHPPREAGGGTAHAMFNSLKGGMGRLVDRLDASLEGVARVTARVAGASRDVERWTIALAGGGALEADEVVFATPASATASLIRGEHPALAEQLASIRYVSTATISCAYLLDDVPQTRPLDGYGMIVPPGEDSRLLAVTWASTKFRHRAPSDGVLLRVFVGGSRDESLADLPDEDLVRLADDEMRAVFGFQRSPMFTRIYRWPQGNPQYDVGHLDRVAEMERLASERPGLRLAGSSYRGVGIPDCIHSALRAVDAILANP